MKDTTPDSHDTDLCEEAASPNSADSPDAADKSGDGEILGVAQAVKLGQYENADAIMKSALLNYPSLEDAHDALVRLEPEMMISGYGRLLLNGQKHRAQEIGNDMASKEGKYDNHAHDRASKYLAIKNEAPVLDRGSEYMCIAEGIDPSTIDIKLIQEDPAIKNLDTTRPKPFRKRKEATTDQRQWDFDT